MRQTPPWLRCGSISNTGRLGSPFSKSSTDSADITAPNQIQQVPERTPHPAEVHLPRDLRLEQGTWFGATQGTLHFEPVRPLSPNSYTLIRAPLVLFRTF